MTVMDATKKVITASFHCFYMNPIIVTPCAYSFVRAQVLAGAGAGRCFNNNLIRRFCILKHAQTPCLPITVRPDGGKDKTA
jgi:hypothetical protein